MDLRDEDTGKEVQNHPQYIEHSTHNASQYVPSRHSAYLPEHVPNSDLEVFVEHPKYVQDNDSKPLPPPPVYNVAVPEENQNPEKRESSWRRPNKKMIIIAVVAVLAIIIAIVVGAVVGTRSSGSSDKDDSESSSSSPSSTASSASPSASSSSVAVPSEKDVEMGSSFTASFTYYGSGDTGDNVSCKTLDTACGIMADPGYSIMVSENLYGLGVTCGTCWNLQADNEVIGDAVINKTIVALVNEMCPQLGNPQCGQKDLKSENQYDAQVHINLCVDSGAYDGLFGEGSGIGLARGTITRVSCEDEWDGKRIE